MQEVLIFFHNYYPSEVFFKLGPFSIHWYGLLIVLGIISGFFITLNLAKKYGIPKDYIYNLTFYLVIFGLLGARFYHVLVEISYYRQNLLEMFKIWQGGLAMHGALIAGAVVIWVYSKKFLSLFSLNWIAEGKPLSRRKSFWLLADLLAPAILLMHIFVRLGNWFNQELYGRPTNLPWGIPIELVNRLREYESYLYFHPIFLYEIIFCLILFFVLIWVHKIKLKGISLKQKLFLKTKNKNGSIFLIYLIFYSLFRFFLEFIRVDPQSFILGLRLTQIVSILVIISGLVILALRGFKNTKLAKINHFLKT